MLRLFRPQRAARLPLSLATLSQPGQVWLQRLCNTSVVLPVLTQLSCVKPGWPTSPPVGPTRLTDRDWLCEAGSFNGSSPPVDRTGTAQHRLKDAYSAADIDRDQSVDRCSTNHPQLVSTRTVMNGPNSRSDTSCCCCGMFMYMVPCHSSGLSPTPLKSRFHEWWAQCRRWALTYRNRR